MKAEGLKGTQRILRKQEDPSFMELFLGVLEAS